MDVLPVVTIKNWPNDWEVPLKYMAVFLYSLKFYTAAEIMAVFLYSLTERTEHPCSVKQDSLDLERKFLRIALHGLW